MQYKTASEMSSAQKKKNKGWKFPKLPKSLGGGSTKSTVAATSTTAPPRVHQPVHLDEKRKQVNSSNKSSNTFFKAPKFKLPKALGGSSSAKSTAKTVRKERLLEIKQEASKEKRTAEKNHEVCSSLKVYKNTFVKQNELWNDDLQMMMNNSLTILKKTGDGLKTERSRLMEPMHELDLQFERQVAYSSTQNKLILDTMTRGFEETFTIIGDGQSSHNDIIIKVSMEFDGYKVPILEHDILTKYKTKELEWVEESVISEGISWGQIDWLQRWYINFIKILAIDITIQRKKFESNEFGSDAWERILGSILTRGRSAIANRHRHFVDTRTLMLGVEYFNATYEHFKTNI